MINNNPDYSPNVKKALLLHQQGMYQKAKLLYVEALEVDPYDAQALQLLGTILYIEDEKSSAIQLIKNSLNINPNIYDSHNNLANIYKNDKNYNLALKHYRKAIILQPTNALAYNNIAIVYKEQKNYNLAIENYNSAIKHNSNYAEAYSNLANLYFELIAYDKAISFYKQAIICNPNLQKPYSMLSSIFQILNNIPSSLKILQKYIKLQNADEIHTSLAIYAWIDGDIEKSITHLKKIKKYNFNENSQTDRFIIAYKSFLIDLNRYKNQNNSLYSLDKTLKKLYVIGDSHSLSYSNLKVIYKGTSCRVITKIIIGAKAWHLASKENNRYKVQFKNIISDLKEDSKVILLFGEIDCRLDEGILKNHREKDTNMEKSIPKFVKNYINNTQKICIKKNILPIYSTIPAPFIEKSIDKDSKFKQISIIEIFNKTIEEICPINQIYNTHTKTSNQLKESNGKFHIDKWHLFPNTILDFLQNS